MASRNIVIKNNTRCFKSALQQSLNFSFLIFFIPFLPFIPVPLAIGTTAMQPPNLGSGFVNHRHHYVHVQFVTVPFCVSSREWGQLPYESNGDANFGLTQLRVIILTPKRIAQGCVQRQNLTSKKQMPSYCVGVSSHQA